AALAAPVHKPDQMRSAVVATVVIHSRLGLILERMERALDVVFDLLARSTAISRSRRINHVTRCIQEPLADVEIHRGVFRRRINDERWIEAHLQTSAHRRSEHERRSLERALDAHTLTDNIRVRAVEGRRRSGRRLQLRLELGIRDRKSTRLNSSHLGISYAVFCLKKKKKI